MAVETNSWLDLEIWRLMPLLRRSGGAGCSLVLQLDSF